MEAGQALEAFFGDLRTAMLHILPELGPESFVGRRGLSFHTTGQLRGQVITGTQLCIHPFVKPGHIADFTPFEGVATHRIEPIPIRQLRLP